MIEPDAYNEAVREWVARAMNKGNKGCRPVKITRDNVRNVRFGTQAGWVGTDVTPGDPDYTAVVFEYRIPGGNWRHGDLHIDAEPLDAIVRECILIFDEIAPYARQGQREKRAAELLATAPVDPSQIGRQRDGERRSVRRLNDRMDEWVNGR